MPIYKKCYIKSGSDKPKENCCHARCRQSVRNVCEQCTDTADPFPACPKVTFAVNNKSKQARQRNCCHKAGRYMSIDQDDESKQAMETQSNFAEQERLCKAEAEIRRLRKLLKQQKCNTAEKSEEKCKEITVINDPCYCHTNNSRKSKCNCGCEDCCKILRSKRSIPCCVDLKGRSRNGKPACLCGCTRTQPPPEFWCNTEEPPCSNGYDPYYAPSYISSQSGFNRYIPGDFPPRMQSAYAIRAPFAEPQMPQPPFAPQFPLSQPSYIPIGPEQRPVFMEQSPYIRQASYIPQNSFISPSVIREPSFAPQQPMIQSFGRYIVTGQASQLGDVRNFEPEQQFGQGSSMIQNPQVIRSPSMMQGSQMNQEQFIFQEPEMRSEFNAVSSTMQQEPTLMYEESQVVRGPSMIQEPQMSRGPSMIQEPQMSRGPSMIQQSQMSRGPSIIQESQMNRGPSMIQEPQMSRGPSMIQQPQMSRGPSMIQESQINRGPSMIQEPQTSRGTSMIREPQDSGPPSMSQESQMSRGPSMIRESQMNQGSMVEEPQMSRGPSMIQEPQMSQGPSMVEEPQMSRGPSMIQEPQMSRGPSMIQEPQMSRGTSMIQEPQLSRGPSMIQEPQMNQGPSAMDQDSQNNQENSRGRTKGAESQIRASNNQQFVNDGESTAQTLDLVPQKNRSRMSNVSNGNLSAGMDNRVSWSDWSNYGAKSSDSRFIYQRPEIPLQEPSFMFDTTLFQNVFNNGGQSFDSMRGGAEQHSISQQFKQRRQQSSPLTRHSSIFFPSSLSTQRFSCIAQRPMSRTSVSNMRRGSKRSSFEAQLPSDPDDSTDSYNQIWNKFSFS